MSVVQLCYMKGKANTRVISCILVMQTNGKVHYEYGWKSATGHSMMTTRILVRMDCLRP